MMLYNNIKNAESQFHREPNSVQLLAVSKTQSSQKIREIWREGQCTFGENYLQEALIKISELKDTNIEWHFIGAIQNNKTRKIAENFSWVHTIEQEKTAQRLNDQRPENLPALNICIEINLDHEKTKSGIHLSNQYESNRLFWLVEKILTMPRLKLRGLMSIPELSENTDKQRAKFATLRCVLDQLNAQFNLSLDTLSIGMSQDYVAAIAEGATIVRIGTALFGEREV